MSGERQALNELLDELVQEARDVERYDYDRTRVQALKESWLAIGEIRAKIVAECDAMDSALRSAREDSARLDWIEANAASVGRVWKRDEWSCELPERGYLGRCNAVLREAIDAAMSAVSLPQPERDDDGE